MRQYKSKFVIVHTHGDFAAPVRCVSYNQAALWYAKSVVKADKDEVVIVDVMRRANQKVRRIRVEAVFTVTKSQPR